MKKCSKTDMQCLGKRLKEIMRTEEAYKILPPKYNLWDEGGCRILARTLAKVIDGEVWTAVSDVGAEHYLVHKRGYLLDAKGGRKFNEFIREFHKETGKPVGISTREVRSSEIPIDKSIEKKLDSYLKEKLIKKD